MHDINIRINAENLFNKDLFSYRNFSITDTTNNPAMACIADKNRPDVNSK